MRTCSGAKAPDNSPRPAPTRQGPLDFPQYQVQSNLSAAHQHAQNLGKLFLGAEKKVSAQHVEALNIKLLGELPLERLIPEAHLPPSTWLQDPSLPAASSDQGQDEATSNQKAPEPEHEGFYHRAKELLQGNDECFDSLPGRPGARRPSPVKLTHAAKFYQNLLPMTESWDTSKDNYTTDGKEMYTGRRYSAGHEMPERYREDIVSAFVELCIWPFSCTLQNPRSSVNRKLQLGKQYIPIQPITTTVCRNPTNRQKARQGILEGPLVGIHCRNTTTFRTANDAVGEGKEEIMSLLYEVGAALLIAQKRAREGKKEEKPWQDRFWARAEKRHLGEMGGGKQDSETNARARREIEAAKSGVEPMEGVEMDRKDNDNNESDGNKEPKKRIQGPRQAYLATKPPESQWERNMEYRSIGKKPGAGFDNVSSPPIVPIMTLQQYHEILIRLVSFQIYLISSINHHISIVNIRIDDRYLDFVTNGSEEEHFDPSTEEWWRLDVKRSKWYDLFDPRDRGQAMRGVWGIMRWMMRDVGTG
ncbi:MAG: hypothetical protein Q9221_002491 [Calogaya cf. arnoldii]